jgi:hypothetical protein
MPKEWRMNTYVTWCLGSVYQNGLYQIVILALPADLAKPFATISAFNKTSQQCSIQGQMDRWKG